MDSFNNSFTSSTSIKPSSVTNPSFNGGNDENELNPEMASKLKKQLPTKNFISPTICTANKANVPKKKILGERNETLDVVEQPSLRRSSSFDSKSVKSPDDDVQKPYDPINNYLSPRPKFLRYNPNRRRKIYVLQGNEESVRSNNSFDAGLPYPGMELGADSYGFVDSCSQKESVEVEQEQAPDMINNEGECEEGKGEEEGEEEDDEEEEIEFEEDRFWSLKGVLKFLVVVIAVISTTQAICSMNSHTPFHTVDAWSTVYGIAGFNISEVRSCSLRETDFVVGKLKEVDMVESIDGVHDDIVSVEETSDSLQELGTPDFDVQIEETDVVQVEMWSKQEDAVDIAASEVIEIREVESEREVDDQLLTPDSDENEEIAEEMKEIYNFEVEREDDQLLTADSNENEEIAEEMKEIYDLEVEREDDQMLTADSDENEEIAEEPEVLNDVETFDLNLALLVGGFMLILTSLGVMYSKRLKPSSTVTPSFNHEAEKEDIRVLKPSENASNFRKQIDEEQLMNSTSLLRHDVSEEFSHIHAPSVELLGEFVFGEEAHANDSSTYLSGDTKSSRVENSVGDSVSYTEKMVRKQRRKNAEATAMVTPSSVRRSSRLQNRSIKSP